MNRFLLLLLTLSLPASGAFSRLSHCAGNGNNNTCTLDSTGADFIAITVSSDSTVNNITESGNGGANSYTLAVPNTAGGSQLTMYYTYGASLHTGASHVFQVGVSGTPGFSNFYVAAYSGSLTSADPKDGSPTTNTTPGGTIQAGSYTPNCSNELLLSGLAAFGVGVPTITGAGWSITDSLQNATGYSGGMADLIQTTATANSGPVWTCPSAGTCFASSVLGFKAATSVCANNAITRRFIGMGR